MDLENATRQTRSLADGAFGHFAKLVRSLITCAAGTVLGEAGAYCANLSIEKCNA